VSPAVPLLSMQVTDGQDLCKHQVQMGALAMKHHVRGMPRVCWLSVPLEIRNLIAVLWHRGDLSAKDVDGFTEGSSASNILEIINAMNVLLESERFPFGMFHYMTYDEAVSNYETDPSMEKRFHSFVHKDVLAHGTKCASFSAVRNDGTQHYADTRLATLDTILTGPEPTTVRA
jgi:hypothetical protein